MRFSIIIPVYNVEKYLGQAIESILSQTFRDFEIILVNDGSTDNSEKICIKYTEKYKNIIKALHKKNEGPMLARRDGFTISKAEYILFIDSDDLIRNDSLEKLNDIIDKTSSDLIIYNYSRKQDFSDKNLNFTFGRNEFVDKRKLLKSSLDERVLNSLCNKCIKRELIDIETNYDKYKNYNMCEDLIQCLPIVDKCEKPFYLDESLYYYRENTESISMVYNDRMYDSMVLAYKTKLEYSEKWNMDYKPTIPVWCIVVLSKSNLDLKQKRCELRRMLSDDYFKFSYKNGNKKNISLKIRTFIFVSVILNKMRLI